MEVDSAPWSDDDPLLLQPGDLPPDSLRLPRASPALRAAVNDGAMRALSRRRHGRTAAGLTLLVLTYAAGVGSGAWFAAPEPPARPDSGDRVETSEEPQRPTPPAGTTSPDGAALEDLALRASSPDAIALWTAAGDRHLQTGGDVQAALRCYRERVALDGDAEEPTPAEGGESWLLLALRNARAMEDSIR